MPVEQRTYVLVNIILAGVIIMVMVYSGLFTAEGERHPVPSFYEALTGEPSPSAGMSRAFSELVRGRIDPARNYNEDSPLIFAFFLVQLVQRITVTLLIRKAFFPLKAILWPDIALSLGIFIYCFKGQIIKSATLIF